jgi:hypothetical protein
MDGFWKQWQGSLHSPLQDNSDVPTPLLKVADQEPHLNLPFSP